MNYLFFDIECASVGKTVAKICAFGYCLTDGDFRILEKEDILINPQGGFHLTDRKGSQGLVLPYSYAEFRNKPTYPEVADRIYALLEAPDVLPVGHAAMNDVKYLNFESQRFHLPSHRFRFADTQFLYMNRVGVFDRQFALGTIAEALKVEFTQHNASEDAYATMRVAEAMCREEGCSLPELIEKYKIRLGKIENYVITGTVSEGAVADRKAREAAKIERQRARGKFHAFVERSKKKQAAEGVLHGKSVCFSHAVEESSAARGLLEAVLSAGGGYAYHAADADIFVIPDGETARHGNALTLGEFGRALGVEK